MSVEGQAVTRLSKDLAYAAATISADEARFLVDYYYTAQQDRIRSDNQIRSLIERREPCSLINWLSEQTGVIEQQIKRALQKYAEGNVVGAWSLDQMGIGPVIAAGLLAHIDIEKAPTVGHIWSFAGLDPNSKWEKGQKRPWNARLKTLCWHVGESFVKVKGKETAFYGHYYETRKEYRTQKNEAGGYEEQALAIAKARPTHAQVSTYKEGKLPKGHLHAQAKRDAVKLFLAHWHEVAYKAHYGKAPPLPYPIAHMGHAHVIPVPGM